MFLTRISISQPVFTTMVMVAVMAFGLLAWRTVPIDRYPDVDFPVVAVLTPYSGASPDSVESDVTKLVEDELATLSGIESITSTSSQGHSTVVVQFTLETDSAVAVQDVRDRVAAVAPDLPEDADAPQVVRFNPTDTPVISLALSSDQLDQGALTRLAEDVIQPRLTAIDGVGSATLVGSVEDEVGIFLDPERLRAFGLGVSDVADALRRDNLLMPAGSLTSGSQMLSVQFNSEAQVVADLARLVVAERSGELIRLGELAQIRQGTSDPDSLAYQDGRSALAIEVVRVDGGNTVAVATGVEAAIHEMAEEGVLGEARIDVLTNAAIPIEQNYETVQATLLEGAVLAVVIVFFFLNSWRSTVITALTLPISFLGTLAVISLLGFSLNMMTMLALTLSVGILIDDAIVVRENITRHLSMGKGHVQAAMDGTAEIGLAVLATTFALCSVFLPLAFMSGIVGRFFLQFGITVSVAVLISLFVSFTLDPMLSSVWYDPHSEPGARRGRFGRVIARFEHGFERLALRYSRLLAICLRWRKATLAAALACFMGSMALFPMLGFEFLPVGDESRITIEMKTATGSSKEYTALKAAQVADLLQDLPEVAGIYTAVASGNSSADNEATMEVNLVPPAERALSAEAMVPGLRGLLVQVPGVQLTVAPAGGIGSGDAPIELTVLGDDGAALAAAARDIAAMVAEVPGTVDVTLSSEEAQPMLDFVIRREVAADLGVSPQSVGTTLRTLVEGEEVSEMRREDGETDPIVLRLPEDLRREPASLSSLPVAQASGYAVTLGEVTQREETFGSAVIEREARTRVIAIESGLDGRVLGEVMADINAGLDRMNLPPGITLGVGGDAEQMGDTVASMALALGMAVVCIYLVLASQFASFLQPLAIMAALPLALIGAVPALLVVGSTMNIYSMIGLVMLMGLVVKNSILLVDNANQQRRAGKTLNAALIEAGITRFRPIVMTTLAMIFGMLPLAAAIHPGSEQSASMAQAVIGGLISSTVLTLVVVPVVLTYLDALGRLASRLLAAAGPPHAPHPGPAGPAP